MLEVVPIDKAIGLLATRFEAIGPRACGKAANAAPLGHLGRTAISPATGEMRRVPLSRALGCALAHDLVSAEGIPPFDRSTVDGFAVVAADTFGCSDALPAMPELVGEVEMGIDPTERCSSGTCMRIPTGGRVPEGADAIVMLEYCEDYGDGTIGVARPVAPGDNIVFAHDDVKPGEVLVAAGSVLRAHHIGLLASLGATEVEVEDGAPEEEGAGDADVETESALDAEAEIPDDLRVCQGGYSLLAPLRVGVISTGDEIVDVSCTPVAAQMRDVNAPMLAAAVEACGAHAVRFPIVPDDYDALLATVREALFTCDMVLISGGSSAGEKDNTARVLSELGELLFHGIAVKPGKPTMCANADGKPVFGLPGHPVAAYFMFLELARPLLGAGPLPNVEATLAEALPSNHGRSERVAVRLERRDDALTAVPIRSKSGLISQLAGADGFVAIDRNQEGLPAGAAVRVSLLP